MSPTLPIDNEIDAQRRPLVAIPWRWSQWLVYAAPIVPGVLLLGSMMIDEGKRPGQVHDAFRWVTILGPSALLLAILAPAAFWLGRAPEFAVFKDGLKLNVQRFAPGRSLRDPWNYGFYNWSEVTYCRWSPYQQEVLSIHLAGVETQAALYPAADQHGKLKVPPMIHFYPVPERYRAAVEAAIRACGKWVE